MNKHRIQKMQGLYENQPQFYGSQYAGRVKHVGRPSGERIQTENSTMENMEPGRAPFSDGVRASNNTAVAG
jgi:hypothetical protein